MFFFQAQWLFDYLELIFASDTQTTTVSLDVGIRFKVVNVEVEKLVDQSIQVMK